VTSRTQVVEGGQSWRHGTSGAKVTFDGQEDAFERTVVAFALVRECCGDLDIEDAARSFNPLAAMAGSASPRWRFASN
jgi:hypothetical protein